MHRNFATAAVAPMLDQFLGASSEMLRAVAPNTVVFDADGTRRRAALMRITPNSEEYVRFTRNEMVKCFEMLFDHGIGYILTGVIMETNLREVTRGYREKLSAWVDWGLAGPEALADYKQWGWRVRLIGTEHTPEFQRTADRLEQETGQHTGPSVWFSVTSHADAHWDAILRASQTLGKTTRSELIRAMYGEDIPPATLYLGGGKPEVSAANIPLILIGNLQCYWRQHLGYDLNEVTFRRILYDYAYLRNTWEKDKSGRAEKALLYRDAWADPPILGIGERMGPFWYPANQNYPVPSALEHTGEGN